MIVIYAASLTYLFIVLPTKGDLLSTLSEEFTTLAPPQCGPDEVYNPCPGYCTFDEDCLSYVWGIIRDCTTPAPDWVCAPRCECQPGTVRINGSCVSPDNCCEELNTHVVDCPAPCEDTCYLTQVPECIEQCYRRICQCSPGYVRYNNTCILKSTCDYSCPGPNEVYSSCKNPCPETCQSIRVTQWPPIACGAPYPCPGGCDCKHGYVRDDNEVCVQRESCFNCNDPNAEFVQCRDSSPLSCNNLLTHNSTSTTSSSVCLAPGCQCKPGYVKRNDLANADCILASECPPLQCGPNEIYNPCPDYCTFDDDCPAYVDGRITDCPSPPPNYVCVPRCECQTGTVRINGSCVSPDKCCEEPNTHLEDCPAPCENSCYLTYVSECVVPCLKRICQCEPGYVRQNHTCILKSTCDYSCPGPNEVYSSCKNPCPETCQSIRVTQWPPILCAPLNPCPGGCDCKQGYVRDDDMVCVPRESCLPANCSDTNAEYVSCPDPCPLTCNNLHTEGSVPCTRLCLAHGCQCKEGYVKRDDSVGALCIQESECPPGCGGDENAEVRPCGDPCPITCDNKDDTGPRICPDICLINGCACKSGYVKNKDGKCINPKNCPIDCKDPRKEYLECGSACPPTCANRYPYCTKQCKKGCFCKKGYVLNCEGKCVPPRACPWI